MTTHTHHQGRLAYHQDGHTALVHPEGSDKSDHFAHLAPMHHSVGDTLENARRIAACWNACEGLPTQHLETFPGTMAIKAGIVGMWSSYCNKKSELEDMRTERDQLLAALRLYEAAHESLFTQCCSNPITNAWGKQVDVTTLNEAHGQAQSVLRDIDKPEPEAPAPAPQPEPTYCKPTCAKEDQQPQPDGGPGYICRKCGFDMPF